MTYNKDENYTICKSCCRSKVRIAQKVNWEKSRSKVRFVDQDLKVWNGYMCPECFRSYKRIKYKGEKDGV